MRHIVATILLEISSVFFWLAGVVRKASQKLRWWGVCIALPKLPKEKNRR